MSVEYKVVNPATGAGRERVPDCHRRGDRRSDRAIGRGVPVLEHDAGRRARRGAPPGRRPLRRAHHRARGAHHPRDGQDHGRGRRRDRVRRRHLPLLRRPRARRCSPTSRSRRPTGGNAIVRKSADRPAARDHAVELPLLPGRPVRRPEPDGRQHDPAQARPAVPGVGARDGAALPRRRPEVRRVRQPLRQQRAGRRHHRRPARARRLGHRQRAGRHGRGGARRPAPQEGRARARRLRRRSSCSTPTTCRASWTSAVVAPDGERRSGLQRGQAVHRGRRSCTTTSSSSSPRRWPRRPPATRSTRTTSYGPLSSEAAAAGLHGAGAGRHRQGRHRAHRRHASRRARAPSSRPPCSPTSPRRCAPSARSSSARSPWSTRSAASTRRSRWPTTRPFGLGGAVFHTDPAVALDVANRLDTGMVWINEAEGGGPDLPFGGTKRSGVGRELGPYGIDEFVNRKLIHVPAAGRAARPSREVRGRRGGPMTSGPVHDGPPERRDVVRERFVTLESLVPAEREWKPATSFEASPPLNDASDEELGFAFAGNLFDLFRAMSRLPDADIEETPSLVRHCAFPFNPMFKGVWQPRLPTEGEVIDETIDQTIDWFRGGRRRSSSGGWILVPRRPTSEIDSRHVDSPPGRPTRRDGRGSRSTRLRVMTRVPDGYDQERVTDEQGLLDFKAAFVEGFGVPEWAGQAWVDATSSVRSGDGPLAVLRRATRRGARVQHDPVQRRRRGLRLRRGHRCLGTRGRHRSRDHPRRVRRRSAGGVSTRCSVRDRAGMPGLPADRFSRPAGDHQQVPVAGALTPRLAREQPPGASCADLRNRRSSLVSRRRHSGIASRRFG